MEYQQIVFATPIWGFVLNNERLHCLDYIDYILELEKNEPCEKKSNIGGFQSRDNLHKDSIFQELIGNLNNIVLTSLNINPEIVNNLAIDSMWANVNRYRDFNLGHIHQGVLSGVFYLNVPDSSGSLVFCNPSVRAELSPLIEKEYKIQPQNYACILFPSWLEHYVEPNLNEKENRISISFNLNYKK